MVPVRNVAVIGAGTMGHGIAYIVALAGYRVALSDTDPAALEHGIARVRAAFDRAVERGKCTSQAREEGLRRLVLAMTVADAATEADIVIEAIPERLPLKQALFAELERYARPDTLLASNTSSLSITEIGAVLARPGRMIGLHFFNPVPVMKLVEIVQGRDTAPETTEAARRLAESLGKVPIVVRDTPGFATSRLGVVLGLEAIRMLEQEVATAEDIDRAMELGYNHPMGPLKLTDVVGLDVRLAIAEHLHATLGDDTYRPPALLRRLVSEGKLGKKSGQGFYRWEE